MNNTSGYQQCTRCVMDTSASEITFDNLGVCNFCTEFIDRSRHIIYENADKKTVQLNALVERIKIDGRRKPYDCIVGVSGGVDSSWTLVEVKRLGLRPLAVHMDNGWNSEMAQNNISNLIQKLGVDLYTYVIDWEEYKSLMQSFFDADVIDVELLYDNAMLAVNYQMANKYGLNFILSGSNQTSEGMAMPNDWNWFKLDKTNIVDIAASRTKTKLKTFPSISISNFLFYRYIKGIKWISFLDYIDYNKNQSMDALSYGYGYKKYPYKHYESIFTRFYQGYILPNKFNIDKRRLHLSCLIASGQMNRKEVIECINSGPCSDDSSINEDIAYFLKKMRWSRHDLENYISRPPQSHENYKSEKWFWNFLLRIKTFLKKTLMLCGQ